MPYPIILAADGAEFARLNPDASWSVRWDQAFDHAYTKPKPHQKAVHAYGQLLVAAKDNFLITPWEVSDGMSEQWQHFEAIIDYMDLPGFQSTIAYEDDLLARVNYDGSWSVRWDAVLEIARWTDYSYAGIALFGICRLLRAGQYRFLTTPWTISEDD